MDFIVFFVFLLLFTFLNVCSLSSKFQLLSFNAMRIRNSTYYKRHVFKD